MVAMVLRSSFRKMALGLSPTGDYRRFDNFSFREKVEEELGSYPLKMPDFSFFLSTVECILNKRAPLKKKYVRANDGPCVTRELRDVIMKRSNFKNKSNKMIKK